MGELYERIFATDETRLKIGHWFESLMGELAAGDISAAEAFAAWETITGSAPSAAVQQEIEDIAATVTAIPVPVAPNPLGANPNANTLRDYARGWGERNQGLGLRAHKVRRILQIIRLADQRAAGYDTPAAMRSKLGVPTR